MSRRSGLPPRRFRRCTVSLDVAYLSHAGPGTARATTLGAGGLFVRTDSGPPEGAPIRVRFRLPGRSALHELDGRVAWVLAPADAGPHAPGMGVAFTDAREIAILAAALDRDADDAAAERRRA